ncbi:MAG TPA: oligosaccharide flippase family protein [Anaerolineae bacterium]|nr:oligosaccharide flippase family protein [Anaerolineae bacterium]HQK15272.1 oligosaccharide flippase family protein [Anaerolineae bacterium]
MQARYAKLREIIVALENRIVGGSFLVFITQLFLFPLSILLARLLLPSGRGQYALIVLIPTFIIQVVDPVFGSAIIYLLGQRQYSVAQMASVMFKMSIVCGLLGVAVFALLMTSVPFLAWVGLDDAHNISGLVWISVLMIPFILASQYFSSILLSIKKIVEYNVIQILSPMIQIFLVISIGLLGQFNLDRAILSYSVALVATSGLSIWFVRKAVPFNLFAFSKTDYQLVKDAFRFGMKGYIGRICSTGGLRLDAFLISSLLDSANLGIYTIAVSLVEKLWLISRSIATVLYPSISNASGDEGTALTTKAGRHTFFVMSLAALTLAILSRPLILTLYGVAYSGAVMALIVLLPGIVLLGMGGIVSCYITGKGHPEYGVPPAIASIVINILLNLYLIPKSGIIGASLASTISYSINAIVLLVIFLKMSRTKIFELFAIRGSDLKLYKTLIVSFYQKLTQWLSTKESFE